MSQKVYQYEFKKPWDTASRSFVRVWTPDVPTIEGNCHIRLEGEVISGLGRSTIQLGQETPSPSVLRQWPDLKNAQWISHDWDMTFKGDGEFYRIGVNAKTERLPMLNAMVNAEPNLRINWMTLTLTFFGGGKIVKPSPPPVVEVEEPYRRNIIL